MTELSGFLYNDAGCPVATTGCGVDIFPTGCNVGKSGGSPTATTDSDACGFWSFSGVTSGQYDVRVTSGCSVRFIRYDNEQNVCRLEIRNLVLNDGSANLYTINLASTSTDRTLTVPDVCGCRTFQFIDQAQTISALHTHSVDIRMQDDVDVSFGTGLDSLIRWSTGDASNHALVLGLKVCNQVFHIAEVCDIGTDWNTAANCLHSELHIHSSCCAAANYLSIGAHNGTIAEIDVVGGTTLTLSAAGSPITDIVLCSTTPTIRLREPTGGGVSYVALQSPALVGNWTFVFPPDDGCSGQQLQVGGCGVTDWASAGSSRSIKHLHRMLCDCAPTILAEIVSTPVYDFTYQDGQGTKDYLTHYTGVTAEDMPDVMHHKGKIFSPVNAFGKTALAIKALEARIHALES